MAAIDQIRVAGDATSERAARHGPRDQPGRRGPRDQPGRRGPRDQAGRRGPRDQAGRRVLPDRAARRTLRDQIARLEGEISALVVASYPRLDPGPPLPSLAGPRLLSLGELEGVRDALAARLSRLRAAAAERRARQSAAARELEQMLADPPAHRWERLTNADLGLPGCTTYHVRPRAGLLGMLMGWWQVKISGGCP